MKPDAGDGTGIVVSWLARAMFISRKSDWNELLKCAAWLVPSSWTSSLLTTSPFGPNTSSNSVDNVDGRDWANSGPGSSTPRDTTNGSRRRTIVHSFLTVWCQRTGLNLTASITQPLDVRRTVIVVSVSEWG